MSTLDSSSSKEDQRSADKTPGAPNTVAVPSDPAAPSTEVSSKRQSLSDIFTIVRAYNKVPQMLMMFYANVFLPAVLLGLRFDQ